ncbi:MAG TPA: DUF1214 domain-containing protein [Xanthobacteraceae bacterium]|nr:DUF1214 domain-containing protein [Xanthobacteraceae bacterium]
MRAAAITIAMIVGIATGLGLTWFASAGAIGFGTVQIGAWTAWPKSGTPEADPYSRAMFARTGELPLGSTDGIAFAATSDDDGTPLSGRCDIHISGRLPTARFWTLTIYDSQGRLIENAAARYGFTSAEVLWRSDSTVEIVLAPRARSGNWIPTGGRDRISAVFRFYDAPTGLGGRSTSAREMPAVWQEFCS